MEKFECQDTTESRILFGFLRKVYNNTLMSKSLSLPICETLVKDVKKTAQFAKYQSKKMNTDIRFSKKKRGNLPSLNQEKTTIIVKDGNVKFKSKVTQKPFSFDLKDSTAIKNGIYTEAFVSWEQKTPFLTLNKEKARFSKPGISEKNIKIRLKSKMKAEQTNFSMKKSYFIKMARNVEKEFGRGSEEFLQAKTELFKNIKDAKNKIKFNLYLYIEQMNNKYSSLKIKESLFVGENQANTDLTIFSTKEGTEITVYNFYYSDTFTIDENNFLLEMLNINRK